LIKIVPISPAHIDSFHRALDFVARERSYLALLEAPPMEEFRSFVQNIVSRGCPQFVALSDGNGRLVRRAADGAADLCPYGRARRGALAAALYERFGFETEGLKRHALKVDGKYENQVLMALLLEDAPLTATC